MSSTTKTNLSRAQLAIVGRLFGVLSEPSRLALLQMLQGGPRTVSQLLEACGLKQANVSKHLSVLHDHRLVKRERAGNCIRYAIADPMIFSLCELVCGKIEQDARCASGLFQATMKQQPSSW